MKIIIFGAGAIGGTVGSYLFLSGREVVLIGRQKQVDLINRQGLKLKAPSGDRYLKISAVTHPDRIKFGPEDIVFLCMKGQNTAEALRDLQSAVSDVPVFCFQNGVRNEEMAAGYFPRVYGVMVRVGAEYLNDGEVLVRREPPGLLIMGRYPQGSDALLENTGGMLRAAGFQVKLVPDVMPYKWGKLTGNLMNIIDAATNAGGKDVAPIVRAAREELTALLREAGIPCISMAEIANDYPEDRVAETSATPAHGSTWQSFARGSGSAETEFLNGEVVRLAKKLGKTAPVNEKLVQVSREMAANGDKPGKFTPAQLAALVGVKPSPPPS